MAGTAWPDGNDVELHSLELGTELGKGGQGAVREIKSPYPGLVCKRYFKTDADATALKRLVDLPDKLAHGEAELLRSQAAWPLARVMDGHEVCGFVMQPIPQRFRGRTSSGTSKPRELQYLLFEPTPLWGDISPPDIDGRIDLARQIVSLIHLLHSRTLVLGDISMNNLLWTRDPTAAVFMIDCDGVRRLGSRPVHPQGETPDWTDPLRTESTDPQQARPADPRQTRPADAQQARPADPRQATPPTARRIRPELDLDNDRYKCALIVGRVLSRNAYVRPGEQLTLLPGIPEPVAARVQSLWQQAARPRGSRPDTNLWILALGRQ